MINAPKSSATHPDRGIHCQEACDDDFRELWRNIVAAGWGPEEVARAIHELTEAQLMARAENAKTDAAIRRARLAVAH